MQEQREMEQLMLRNSKARGLTPATSENLPPVKPRSDDKTGLGTRPPNKLTKQQPQPPPEIKIGSTRKEIIEND
jgi:hypothetical protein